MLFGCEVPEKFVVDNETSLHFAIGGKARR